MKKYIFFLLTIVMLVVVFWQMGAMREGTSGALIAVVAPLWNLQESISVEAKKFSVVFQTKQSLREEAEKLREELRHKDRMLRSANLLNQENKALKALLGRREEGHDALLAVVLAKPPLSPYDTLLLDVGAEHGIREGDIVVAEENIVLGKIHNVYPRVSRAVLFSSYGETVYVSAGDDQITTKAFGKGGGNFEASLPRDITIQKESLITLPSIETDIIGVVENIQQAPSDPLQTILFKSPVNIFELKYVKVQTARGTLEK